MIRIQPRWHIAGWATAVLTAVFLLEGCARFEESGLPGSASSMARNQVMLVRKEPASFGYYRLSSQKSIYPDLALFLEKSGMPDFLAETGDDSRRYFILYYLKQREAYACRSNPDHPHAIEFAGPYPVTEREFRTLDAMRTRKTP